MSIQDVKWPCSKPLIGRKPSGRSKSCKVLVKDGVTLEKPLIEKVRARIPIERDERTVYEAWALAQKEKNLPVISFEEWHRR